MMELLHSASSTSLFTTSDEVLPSFSHKDCENACIAHSVEVHTSYHLQLFGILKTTTSICYTCGEVNERTDFLWHFPVVVSQLLDTAYTPLGLQSIVEKQMRMNVAEQHCTCDHCEKRGTRCEVTRSYGASAEITAREDIVRYPPLFVASLVNASSTQSSSTLKELLKSILAPSSPYHLQSFICYRGFHYVCVCKEREQWIEYSDENAVSFHDDEDMIEYCIHCNSLPVLLFYSHVLHVIGSKE